jgi:deazaflavin-dependent oxidoreductase (nitroreductase family)
MDRSEEIVDNPDQGVAEHIGEYVATDGRRGQWLSGWKAPTLLLVTRGRRSGKLRRTALAYGEDEGRHVLVASNGGAKRHPAWYLNLLEDPAVQVQVGDDKFAARARDARPDESQACAAPGILFAELLRLSCTCVSTAGLRCPVGSQPFGERGLGCRGS